MCTVGDKMTLSLLFLKEPSSLQLFVFQEYRSSEWANAAEENLRERDGKGQVWGLEVPSWSPGVTGT